MAIKLSASGRYQRVIRAGDQRATRRLARKAVSRMPEKTEALTIHVEPKRSDNAVTIRVSSRRNAMPMRKKTRSIRTGPPGVENLYAFRIASHEVSRIAPSTIA